MNIRLRNLLHHQYNKKGVPQSRAGEIPWSFIDWTNAQINAKSMYNTVAVNSGLITGTQWDVMLNKIASSDSTKSLTDSGIWGNYYNKAITECIGRYATYNTSSREMSTFSSEMQTNGIKNSNSNTLLTTGASSKTRAYNIYDVAGNAWEWTEETSFYGGNNEAQYRELRGGSFGDSSATTPVCYRNGSSAIIGINCSVGFRVVLYMK